MTPPELLYCILDEANAWIGAGRCSQLWLLNTLLCSTFTFVAPLVIYLVQPYFPTTS